MLNTETGSENIKCPNCGQKLPSNAIFCFKCGNKLPSLCPQCGSDIVPESEFCIACGAAIKPKTALDQVSADRTETAASGLSDSIADQNSDLQTASSHITEQKEPDSTNPSPQTDNTATWKELERGQQQISRGLDQSLRDFDKAQRESNRAKKEAKRREWLKNSSENIESAPTQQDAAHNQATNAKLDTDHTAPSSEYRQNTAHPLPGSASANSTSESAAKGKNTIMKIAFIGAASAIFLAFAILLPNIILCLFGETLTVRVDNTDTGMLSAAAKKNNNWKKIGRAKLNKGVCTIKVPKNEPLQLVIKAPERQLFISDTFSVSGPAKKTFHLKYIDQDLTVKVNCPKLYDPTLTATVYDDNQTIEPFKITSTSATFTLQVPCEIPLNITIEADKCAPSVTKYTLDPNDRKAKEVTIKLVRNIGTLLITAKGDSASKAQYKLLSRGKELTIKNKCDLSKTNAHINNLDLNTPYDVIVYGRGISRSKKSVKLTTANPDATLEFTANFDSKELVTEAARDANTFLNLLLKEKTSSLKNANSTKQFEEILQYVDKDTSSKLVDDYYANYLAESFIESLNSIFHHGIPYSFKRLGIFWILSYDLGNKHSKNANNQNSWSLLTYKDNIITIRNNKTGLTLKGVYSENENRWRFDLYSLAKSIDSLLVNPQRITPKEYHDIHDIYFDKFYH